LLRQGELTKLARVQVDIPNSLDHLWALDVKKSSAHPPEMVRAGMLRTIERISGESRNVYAFRGRKLQQRGVKHLWQRVDVRDGYNYEINREHPIVVDAGLGSERAQNGRVEPLLRAIEIALPVDAIYHDMASDRLVQAPPGPPDALSVLDVLAEGLLDAVSGDPDARHRLLNGGLLEIDVFAAYPDVTRQITARLRDDG